MYHFEHIIHYWFTRLFCLITLLFGNGALREGRKYKYFKPYFQNKQINKGGGTQSIYSVGLHALVVH